MNVGIEWFKKRWLAMVAVTSVFFSGTAGVSASGVKDETCTERHTVFASGEGGVHVYRIPAVVTAKDSSIIVVAEARYISWEDGTRTDVVAKRSTDGGQTWSETMFLTNDTTGAYMDPTPVVDKETGRIFVFSNFWPTGDRSGKGNVPYLVTSDDNGQTWSAPVSVKEMFLCDNERTMGFGPGNGIQMKGDRHGGRLIVPLRYSVEDEEGLHGYVTALYSDDHGKTWRHGTGHDHSNELQIAEVRPDTLIYNKRWDTERYSSKSYDGGVTWTDEVRETSLPVVSGVTRGCHAAILAKGDTLYYTGIEGKEVTPTHNERARLALYRSIDGGTTWERVKTLHENAAAYSCMDILPDGRVALIIECGDAPGFPRENVPGVRPYRRADPNYMRLDLLVFDPAEL